MIKKLELDQNNYKIAKYKLIIISCTFIIFVFARVLVSTIIIVTNHYTLEFIIFKTFIFFLIFELVLISLVIYVDYKNLYETTEIIYNIGNISSFV